MTLYQTMQMGVGPLKNAIKTTENQKDKRKYLFAFVLKNILCVAFCFVFVTLFSLAFQAENSVVGVLTLLAILAFRFVDFHYDMKESYLAMMLIFVIEAIGPHLGHIVHPALATLVHFVSLLLIVILSCYEVSFANHFVFVLGYILLWGNDVSGLLYFQRLLACLVGGLLVTAVLYHQHRHKLYEVKLKDVFLEFFQHNPRSIWQLKICSLIALVMLLGETFHYPKTMWICFACMSLTTLEPQQHHFKFKRRTPFVIIGGLIFLILYSILPTELLAYMGIIGGICVGFSASYSWQTAFNCLGALATGLTTFGLYGVIILRIVSNFLGSIISYIYQHIFDFFYHFAYKKRMNS